MRTAERPIEKAIRRAIREQKEKEAVRTNNFI